MKNALCEEINQDYRQKLIFKVFDALKINREFRKERAEADVVLTNQVHEIAKKKFFRKWHSLAGKRLGLMMLAESFPKL